MILSTAYENLCMSIKTIIFAIILHSILLTETIADNLQDQLPSNSCSAGNMITPEPCFTGSVSAGGSGNEQGFRNYGITQFYALNWPWLEGSAGVPNIKTTPKGDQISVWQTWRTKSSLYSHKENHKHPSLPKNHQSFIDNHADVPYSKHIEFLQNTSLPTGDDQKLIDQTDNPIYFQIHMNNVAYQDLMKAKKKNKVNVTLPYVEFTVGSGDIIRGAIFVKSAWRIITNMKTAHAKMYHRSFACIEDKGANTTECKMEVVGLVGLHIASKINPISGFSYKDCNKTEGKETCLNKNAIEWSWSSFEFIYNAPVVRNEKDLNNVEKNAPWGLFNTGEAVEKQIRSNCFDKKGVLQLSKQHCTLNDFDSNKKEAATIIRFMSDNRNYKPENLDAKVCRDPVEPLSSLDYSTCNIITAYSEKEESVWKNYRFIDVQWIDQLGSINPEYTSKQPDQTIIRNTSLEPYSRIKTVDNSGCVNCHRNAVKTDAIFSIEDLPKPNSNNGE